MNSPGNFTASKLAWVKEHQPDLFNQIDKIMLPGDWLAMRLTGKVSTTISGLSEGILWDFKEESPAAILMDYYGFDKEILPTRVPTFGIQGELTDVAAADLGLAPGTPVSYRGGDQPNNALSLNVLRPGEIAATAGTSGVVYGVTDQKKVDPQSRVNTFAHVNHSAADPRLGVLLCINGTGILNAWTRRLLGDVSYVEMNELATNVDAGSDGLSVLPFGNGAERVLNNKNMGAHVVGLDFNRHDRGHLCRAVQEGIVFSFMYGMEILKNDNAAINVIRAGNDNLFRSEIKQFIENDTFVSALTLTWEEKITFSLTKEYIFKGLRYLEFVQDQVNDIHTESDMEKFDADFSVMSLLLTEFLARMKSIFSAQNAQVDEGEKENSVVI